MCPGSVRRRCSRFTGLVCLSFVQRQPAPSGHLAHTGLRVTYLIQRQSGAVSPDLQTRRKPEPYDVPGNLGKAVSYFLQRHNNRRRYKVFGSVTPSDALDGRREKVPAYRKWVRAQTLQRKRRYDQLLTELAGSVFDLP